MKLPSKVSDDEQDAEKVESKARLRVAEAVERPFDVRSIALTGLFILAIFYTIYFMRSVLLPVVLALLLSYLFRPVVRRRAHPYWTSCACRFWNLRARNAQRRMDSKSTGRPDRTATQTSSSKKIRSTGHPGH